mgnify:CR=1 FL=1
MVQLPSLLRETAENVPSKRFEAACVKKLLQKVPAIMILVQMEPQRSSNVVFSTPAKYLVGPNQILAEFGNS